MKGNVETRATKGGEIRDKIYFNSIRDMQRDSRGERGEGGNSCRQRLKTHIYNQNIRVTYTH